MQFDRAEPGLMKPGHWRPLGTRDGKSASIMCPQGHYGTLVDHQIDPSGRVEPSVVCPAKDCGFHEHIQLVGWADHLAGIQ